MHQILVVIQVILAIGVIVLVFLQQGKGANMGAAFGSGASGSVFGARGASTFLSRATAICATLFFVTSMALAVIVSRSVERPDSVIDLVGESPSTQEATPVVAPIPDEGESSEPATVAAPSELPPE